MIPNRRPSINTRTDNFHVSVGFNPYTGFPVDVMIVGRGLVGTQLDSELYDLSVKISKLMQGDYLEDDMPRLRKGIDSPAKHKRDGTSSQGKRDNEQSPKVS